MEAGTATIKVEADMTEVRFALRAFKAELLEVEAVVDRLSAKLESLRVHPPQHGGVTWGNT